MFWQAAYSFTGALERKIGTTPILRFTIILTNFYERCVVISVLPGFQTGLRWIAKALYSETD